MLVCRLNLSISLYYSVYKVHSNSNNTVYGSHYGWSCSRWGQWPLMQLWHSVKSSGTYLLAVSVPIIPIVVYDLRRGVVERGVAEKGNK